MELRHAPVCNDSVRLYYASPIVIPSEDQAAVSLGIREPDLILRDEPVREVGKV